jgi:MEMO1 family protein
MHKALLFGALMPHPPLLFPEIGGEETAQVARTQQTMHAASEKIASLSPDLVVLISSHGPMFEEGVGLMGGATLYGNLQEFGVPREFTADNDEEVLSLALEAAAERDLPLVEVDEDLKAEFEIGMELDYGATVPLHQLQESGVTCPILHVSPGGLPVEKLYEIGACIGDVLQRLGRRTVVLASGDNSHALNPDAPMGLRPEGPEFDRRLEACLNDSRWLDLLTMDDDFLERAAEDTVRSCALLLGIFEGVSLKGRVLSHEGPFGVGYTVAEFEPVGDSVPSLLPALRAHREEHLLRVRENESSLVKLARQALETYVRTEEQIPPPIPLPQGLLAPAGCFVSLHMHGQLRGCIGTTEPVFATLAEEIIQNAIHAGIADDRFFPVEEDELESLIYRVDVLEPSESVTDVSQLDPQRYGLIVVKGDRGGILLPDLAGVNTVEEQILYTKEKADVDPEDDDVELYRFEVTRYT